jgi:alpha/beta superfamily hydrolase
MNDLTTDTLVAVCRWQKSDNPHVLSKNLGFSHVCTVAALAAESGDDPAEILADLAECGTWYSGAEFSAEVASVERQREATIRAGEEWADEAATDASNAECGHRTNGARVYREEFEREVDKLIAIVRAEAAR